MGLKVLMIGAYPVEPGRVHGGIESVTSTLVPALAALDEIESVTVLQFHQGEATTPYRREGAKIEIHFVRGQRGLRTITGSFRDVRQARKFAKELRPDVIHGQDLGWSGDIAARCTRNGVVTVHGLPHVEIRLAARTSIKDKLRIIPLDALVRRVLNRAKVVISISEYDQDRLAGMVTGTRVSIANPTGREFFDLAPSIETPPRLLFAGVLSPRKNPIGMLDAFAIVHRTIPEARLVMVGPHPIPDFAQAVRDRVTELGLTEAVQIVGMVSNDDLRAQLAQARAVVLFSREETAPTVIAQAMAAGKPVVAARVGGVAEMVTDGETGFVVESEDVDALADRLVTVLRDQELCLRMGAHGHDVARARFEPGAVATSTVAAYRLAIGETSGAPA